MSHSALAPSPAADRLLADLAETVATEWAMRPPGRAPRFVRGLPVAACTYGERIFLQADLQGAECPLLRRILRHELAHVRQARAGRVRAGRSVAGVPCCTDSTLEAEAIQAEAGRRNEHSAPSDLAVSTAWQAMIAVGGREIVSEAELSSRFQQTLAFIAGGPQWLQWALGVSAPNFSVGSEVQLAELIQGGLHGVPFIYFRSGVNLRMAPSTLMSLSEADFSAVTGSLDSGQLSSAASRALNRAGIRTEAEFRTLSQLLADLGVGQNLVLATAPLDGQVALYDVLISRRAEGSPDATEQAAAAFAAGNAQSPVEFAAAYEFYRAVAAQNASTKADAVGDLAASLWTGLLAVTPAFLSSCPVPTTLPDDLVLAEFERWIAVGNVPGFHDQATAAYNCAVHSGLDLTQSSVDAELIDRYVLETRRFFQVSTTRHHRLLQDGIHRTHQFRHESGSAVLLQQPEIGLSILHAAPTLEVAAERAAGAGAPAGSARHLDKPAPGKPAPGKPAPGKPAPGH